MRPVQTCENYPPRTAEKRALALPVSLPDSADTRGFCRKDGENRARPVGEKLAGRENQKGPARLAPS